MNKAVFLDRDGTIIEDKGYLKDPEGIVLLNRAIPALRMLQDKGYYLIVVTNQSGIGRGLITEEEYQAVHQAFLDKCQSHSINIKDTYYCPSHPTKARGAYLKEDADRKPGPGMILKAMKAHFIDPKVSFMIGDKFSDVDAGNNAELKGSILLRTGNGQSELKSENESKWPEQIAEDLYDAVVEYILP